MHQLFAFCRLDIVYCTFHNKLLIRTSHWFKPFSLLEYQLPAHAPPSVFDWDNLNAIVQTDNTEQWISYQGQCLLNTRLADNADGVFRCNPKRVVHQSESAWFGIPICEVHNLHLQWILFVFAGQALLCIFDTSLSIASCRVLCLFKVLMLRWNMKCPPPRAG